MIIITKEKILNDDLELQLIDKGRTLGRNEVWDSINLKLKNKFSSKIKEMFKAKQFFQNMMMKLLNFNIKISGPFQV